MFSLTRGSETSVLGWGWLRAGPSFRNRKLGRCTAFTGQQELMGRLLVPTDSAHHAQRPHHTLSLGGGSRVVCVELPSFRRSLCRERRRSRPVRRGPQSQRAAAAGEKAAICVAAGEGPACSVRAQGQSGRLVHPQFQCRRRGGQECLLFWVGW